MPPSRSGSDCWAREARLIFWSHFVRLSSSPSLSADPSNARKRGSGVRDHGGGPKSTCLVAGADEGGVRVLLPLPRLPHLLHPGFQVFCLDGCLLPNEGHDEAIALHIAVFGLPCIFPLEY